MDINLLREELTIDEGMKEEIYLCSEGHPTFGIGHLIVRGDPEYGKDVGTKIPFDRIKQAFEQDVANCVADCMLIFKGWDKYPEDAQRVFANMCFQLGRPRLSQFKQSIAYAENGEWEMCATEILDSRWAKQTPNRAKRLSDRLLKLAVPM